MIAMETFARP